MHRFMISTYETVPILGTSLINGRGTKELEQLKGLSFKIQEATLKSIAITERKGKYIRQIKFTNQRHLPRKVTLILTLQMSKSFNMMFQL